MKYSNIKYIYLQAMVPEDFVKYKVEDGEEKKYSMPVGTPLNVVYLLDAVVNYETRLEDTDGKWYVDKDRYTVATDHFKEVYKNEAPGYFINKDQWGTYITGIAPFYDDYGNYIGLIGIDLFLDHYIFSLKRFITIIIIFLLSEILIIFFALYLYSKYIKSQHRVYKQCIISNSDDLTSLLNRRRFMEILKEKWEEGMIKKTPISLFIIDIDYFKEFNDTYGHMAGDYALKNVARCLKENITLGYAARYGGDEFIVMLIDEDENKSQLTANNIINCINKLNIEHLNSQISNYLTLSIGIATLLPRKDITIEKLIYYADVALYNAKELGRNRAQLWNKNIKRKMHIYSEK